MDNPSINMILFLTHTISDGEIVQTYAMGTYLNKAIKVDNSTPIDFSPSRTIKRGSPLYLQTSMLWGYRVIIFVR
jgi:hypothetical protein